MATVLGIDHKVFAFSTVGLTAGIAAFATIQLVRERRRRARENVYETQALVNQYMLFHYGSPSEVLKFDFAPRNSLDFPKRCAELCLKYFKQQEGLPSRALDIGCAVGRSSFELARVVEEVVGIDYSQAFVDACNKMKFTGEMPYAALEEGEVTTKLMAHVDPAIDRRRTKFQRGDACALDLSLGKFGVVLAANLVCRLHHPKMFLNRLPDLVASGGIVVITAPFTWMPEFTDKSEWLGGYLDKNGQPVSGFMGLKEAMDPNFTLLERVDIPFLIRETARKNQWTVANGSVWQRRKN